MNLAQAVGSRYAIIRGLSDCRGMGPGNADGSSAAQHKTTNRHADFANGENLPGSSNMKSHRSEYEPTERQSGIDHGWNERPGPGNRKAVHFRGGPCFHYGSPAD